MADNNVTVTFDLDQVADKVKDYYAELQEGQLAEMFGEQDRAFAQAKKVIGVMADLLDYVVTPENVGKVHDILAERDAAEPADAAAGE